MEALLAIVSLQTIGLVIVMAVMLGLFGLMVTAKSRNSDYTGQQSSFSFGSNGRKSTGMW